ncbi:MAG: MFS superfamily sulfate permease-like transporter, partial [Glaciecola sp.]
FVALPLCLGIALASGAPLFSGLIAGIIGGIVVGSLSGSPLGVSGPAAGLAVIVLNSITDFAPMKAGGEGVDLVAGFEIFLVAVVLAGVIQLLMGILKAGVIAYYFPSSVIYGMLSGIGIIIFIKQIPHALGYDKDPEGDFEFMQVDGQNSFSELINMLDFVDFSVVIITAVSLAILLLWESKAFKKIKLFQVVPGPLVAVVSGILLNMYYNNVLGSGLTIDHLVSVPVAKNMDGFISNFSFPNFSALSNPVIYITAVIIALVASLETLLCVEAADKLDPLKRVTPTNKELRAQGIGNILSGFIGGLPITQVIVRSSANVQAGGKSKLSAIFHGVLLLICVILIPVVLNLIPLAVLAAILLIVGYKLAKPAIFKRMFNQGYGQFIPFVCTIIGVVFIDLLYGLGIGLIVAAVMVPKYILSSAVKVQRDEVNGVVKTTVFLDEEVTFLNKAKLVQLLSNVPEGSEVVLDLSKNNYMHFDVAEIIEDFKVCAKSRDIKVTTIAKK